MSKLEDAKENVQETISDMTEEPGGVKTWGITAASATVGAIAVPTLAKGVVVLAALAAAPTIAVTAGAVGGGVLGWKYMTRSRSAAAA